MRTIAFLLSLFLCGCAQLSSLQATAAVDLIPKLQTIALADAEHALMIAQSNGDEVPQACLMKIIVAIQLVQDATMGAQGIFTTAETARIIQRMNIQQDCQAVIASFF